MELLRRGGEVALNNSAPSKHPPGRRRTTAPKLQSHA